MEAKKPYIVGFTASSFDLLHAGHIAMLKEAKEHCDYLVVGLLTDPTISRPETKNKPIQTMFERFVQLQAVKYVDEIIPFETEQDLEDLILWLMPNIRFIGEEYQGKEYTGKNIRSVQVYFNKRKHSFSSSSLRDRISKT